MEITEMAVGPQGWVRFGTKGGSADVFVRFRPGDDGRWRIHEVYIDSSRPMSPQGLRQVPYAHCEEWANQEEDHLAAEWDVVDAVGDNVSILASHLGTTFGPVWLDEDRQGTNWVATAYHSAFPAEMRAASGLQRIRPPKKRVTLSRRLRRSSDAEASFRLTEGPQTRDLSDEFIFNVARAYRAALARHEPAPNVSIQQSLGGYVDHRTVVRWVAEARRRGYLPPARKGAAG